MQRDMSLIPGLRRSPGEGNGNLLQYSCLENSTERGVWQATVLRAMEQQRVGHNWSSHTGSLGNYGCTCLVFGLPSTEIHNSKLVFVVVQWLRHVHFFAMLWTTAHQASLSSLSPRVCSNSCPLSQSCHLVISSSVVPFSSCPQSFLASGPFSMSWFFTLGGQSIGASASTSVLPMNIQGWFPFRLTDLISFLVQRTLKSLFQYHS